jgi:TP901 family phage tail tape measure protein
VADLQKTVSILFKGVDEISGTVDSISGTMGAFSGKLESATQPLANMASGVEKLDLALAAIAVGGLVLSVNAYANYEQVMLRVSGVMGTSAEEYDRLTTLTRTLGATTQYTAQQAADGLLVLATAGVKADDAMTALPIVLKFAQGAMIDVSVAADIALNSMGNFGLTVGDLERVTDAILATANNSRTSVTQLGEGMKMVSPIANALGMDVEATAAVLGKLADAGFKGEMGGTALRNILLALIAPTDNAGKLFTKLGVDTNELGLNLESAKTALKTLGVVVKDESTGNMRAFPDILTDIMAGLGRMPDQMDQTAAATAIFGKRGGPQMAALLQQGEGAVKALEDTIRSLGGVTVDMADRIEGSMKNTIKIIESSLEAIGLSIGESVKKGVIAGGGGLSEAFSSLVREIDAGSFSPIFDLINKLGVDMGVLFRGIAKSLPEALAMIDYSELVKSFENLGGAFQDIFKVMFGNIDLGTPEGLASAIQKVVDGVTVLMNVSKGIVEGLKPFIEKMTELANEALRSDSSTQELTGKVLGFGQGVNAAVSALNSLAPAMNILSGALALNAVATIGKLGFALGALPAAGAIAAGAAVVALGAGAYELVSKVIEAEDAMDSFDQMLKDTSADGLAAKEKLDAFKDSIHDLPEVKRFMFETDFDTAIDEVAELNRCVLSFPEDFSVEAKTETEDAKAKLNELRFQFEAFPPTTFLELVTDAKQIDDVALKIEGLPTLTALTVQASIENEAYVSQFMSEISKPDIATISIDLSKESVSKFTSEMKKVINPDGTTTWVNVGVDEKSMKETQEALKEIPTEKMLEIKLQGEIDKELAMIKANSENLQSAMEWTAKLDISRVEAETEQIKSMFSAVASTIDSVSGEIEGLFDNVPKSEFDFGAREWKKALEQAMKIQQESFDLEKELIEAQISIIEKRESMMLAGKGLIKIDSTGLEPALEMIMWQILQKVQIKANEDAANFLLGIS